MEYIYEIKRLKTAPQLGDNADVILGIEFIYHASDERDGNTLTAQTLGSIAIDEPSEGSTFIPYADVTEEKVIEWIEATIDVQHMQDVLTENINNQHIPRDVIRDDLPWATE